MTRPKKRPVADKIRRRIVMFYLIFGFPILLTYFLLILLTDLRGRLLLYSILPVAILLIVMYILYLLRPARFFHFWGASGYEHKAP